MNNPADELGRAAVPGQTLIGVISDTHGLLRPEVAPIFAGRCECIIHAGDVGKPAILDELRAIAPIVAVRGNIDKGAWAERLPQTETRQLQGTTIHVLHDLNALENPPAAGGIRVVISGHSHQPRIEKRAGVLFLNPGSAGPRRFRLPITVAILTLVKGNEPTARLIHLETEIQLSEEKSKQRSVTRGWQDKGR